MDELRAKGRIDWSRTAIDSTSIGAKRHYCVRARMDDRRSPEDRERNPGTCDGRWGSGAARRQSPER